MECKDVCPFVEDREPRCGVHLTMRDLASAYAYCADRYMSCPVFQELIAREHQHEQARTGARIPAGV